MSIQHAALAVLYRSENRQIVYTGEFSIRLPPEHEFVSAVTTALLAFTLTSTGRLIQFYSVGDQDGWAGVRLRFPVPQPVRKIIAVGTREFLALLCNGDLYRRCANASIRGYFTAIDTGVDDIFAINNAYVTVRYDPFALAVIPLPP
jgi:hypothetical protein